MSKPFPAVKHLIEALPFGRLRAEWQLADIIVRRRFRVVGACRLGPSRTDDLGLPDWAQSPAAPPCAGAERLAHGPASTCPVRRRLAQSLPPGIPEDGIVTVEVNIRSAGEDRDSGVDPNGAQLRKREEKCLTSSSL